MIFTVELRTTAWPDGEPLARVTVPGTRALARATAVEALRGLPEARIADIRLHHRLIDNYIRRRTTGGVRHLYSARMRHRETT
jgi:hypothetical protein